MPVCRRALVFRQTGLAREIQTRVPPKAAVADRSQDGGRRTDRVAAVNMMRRCAGSLEHKSLRTGGSVVTQGMLYRVLDHRRPEIFA